RRRQPRSRRVRSARPPHDRPAGRLAAPGVLARHAPLPPRRPRPPGRPHRRSGTNAALPEPGARRGTDPPPAPRPARLRARPRPRDYLAGDGEDPQALVAANGDAPGG